MAERRVGVRVSVTGRDTDEFRNMARDAGVASAAIKAIPNRVTVRADTSGLSKIERDAQRAQRSSSLLVDSIALLTPTLAPLSAVAIAGIGGIANQAAIATASLGPMLLALSGVGDAVEALGKARTEPTAENLQAAQQALAAMPSDAAEFARYLDSLRPVLDQLRAASANGGFLDGLTSGMQTLIDGRMPQFLSIITEISAAQGQLSRAVGESLAGPEFDALFDMLQRTARPTLLDLGAALGDLAKTGANLWTAFEPLNMDFSRGFRNAMAGLEQASRTTDFTEFIAYVREATPDVLDALGSLGNLLVQIVEAGAPLGGPTLAIIEATADALSAIADSPAGPALLATAAGFAALNRALVVQARLRDSLASNLLFGRGAASGADAQTRGIVAYGRGLRAAIPTASQFGTVMYRAGQSAQNASTKTLAARSAVGGFARSVGPAAAGAAALGVAVSGVADDMNLGNTATLGLAGAMAGPLGAAVGTAVGAFLDLRSAGEGAAQAIQSFYDAADSGDTAQMRTNLQSAREILRDLETNSGAMDWLDDLDLANSIRINEGVLDPIRFLRDEIALMEGELNGVNAGGLASALSAGLSPAAQGVARDMDGAASAAQRMQTAFQQAAGTLSLRAALREARDAARDFNAQVRESGGSVRRGSAAYDELEAGLDRMAQGFISVAEKMEPLQAGRYLQNARRDFVAAAESMDVPRRKAVQLADQLGLVRDRSNIRAQVTADTAEADRKVKATRNEFEAFNSVIARPRVVANTSQAQSQLSILRNLLAGINSKSITVRTTYLEQRQIAITRSGAGVNAPVARADGGSVPGPRYPYGDKVLAYLAPGEEVITNRNGEADRFRRDRAAGRIPAYADGGMVQAYAASGRRASGPTSVNVSAPPVTVGGANLQVFIDGQEVAYIVREVNEADAQHAAGARIGR